LEGRGADPEVLALAGSAALVQTRKPNGRDLPLPSEGIGVVLGNAQDFGHLGQGQEPVFAIAGPSWGFRPQPEPGALL